MTTRIRPAVKWPLTALLAMLAPIAAFDAQAQAGGAAGKAASAAGSTGRAVDSGRELFGVRCARCHGAEATGTANAPDLLPRVKGMSQESFSAAVLQRHRWSLPAIESAGESAAREAMIRGVPTRQEGGAGMRAWESSAAVSQGVDALYEYLGARVR